VSRAAAKPITLQWFSLSALRRLGWGELRIRAAFKQAFPGHWRGYPQLEVSTTDWANAATNIDCEADTADIIRAGREPGDPMLWTERIEELALLLPADADGAPLSPEDAQAALALPAKVNPGVKIVPEQRLVPKAWLKQAVKDIPRLKDERPGAYATRLHEAMKADSARLTRVYTAEGLRRALNRK
jgi:hypothetical protein